MKMICGKTSSIAGLRVYAAPVLIIRECRDRPIDATEITSLSRIQRVNTLDTLPMFRQ